MKDHHGRCCQQMVCLDSDSDLAIIGFPFGWVPLQSCSNHVRHTPGFWVLYDDTSYFIPESIAIEFVSNNRLWCCDTGTKSLHLIWRSGTSRWDMWMPGPWFKKRCRLISIEIPVVVIRRFYDRFKPCNGICYARKTLHRISAQLWCRHTDTWSEWT